MQDDTQADVVDILSEENNDLFFKISIEGSAAGPAKARLSCEAGDVLYGFNGYATEGDVVQFTIPKGKLPTGQYTSSVEVFIENKYFMPVSFTMNVQQPVQVTVESVKFPKRVTREPVKVSAQIEKKSAAPTTAPVNKAESVGKPKFPTLKEKFRS